MPKSRRTRKQLVGKIENRNCREREKDLRALRRELRRAWRERTRRLADTDEVDTESETTPDA